MRTPITLIFCLFLFNTGFANWNFASKTHVVGSSIHTTYFLTPNNASFEVKAKAYLGKFINGKCVYNAINDMGSELLKTGDFVDFDGNQLRMIVGLNYNCMSVYYTYQQLVIETFLLVSDGINYIASIPPTSEVIIDTSKIRTNTLLKF